MLAHILATPHGRGCLGMPCEKHGAVGRSRSWRSYAAEHFHTVWSMPPDDFRSRCGSVALKNGSRSFGSAAAAPRDKSAAPARAGENAEFGGAGFLSTPAATRIICVVAWTTCIGIRKAWVGRACANWPWSTFHRFVLDGEYTVDWGGENPRTDADILDSQRAVAVAVGWATRGEA